MASGARKGRAVPKFGEWEGNNQNQAGFTVIFNKARDEKRANNAAVKGAPPSAFDPPPQPKPVSALAPPRLPKNESHCTIKPPNNDAKKTDPIFKPDPVSSKTDNTFNDRPPVHDDNQFYPPPKRRWFCCG